MYNYTCIFSSSSPFRCSVGRSILWPIPSLLKRSRISLTLRSLRSVYMETSRSDMVAHSCTTIHMTSGEIVFPVGKPNTHRVPSYVPIPQSFLSFLVVHALHALPSFPFLVTHTSLWQYFACSLVFSVYDSSCCATSMIFATSLVLTHPNRTYSFSYL